MAICGAAANASAAAIPAFTAAGMMRVLNGGDTTKNAVARTSASANAVTMIGSNVKVITSLYELRRWGIIA